MSYAIQEQPLARNQLYGSCKSAASHKPAAGYKRHNNRSKTLQLIEFPTSLQNCNSGTCITMPPRKPCKRTISMVFKRRDLFEIQCP